MNVTRFVNGKSVSEKNFKNLSIKNEYAEKIISNAIKRLTEEGNKNA